MGLLNFLLNITSYTIPIAYAGSPTSSAIEKKMSASQYATVFREGNVKKDMTGLTPFLIEGNSLEPEGIKDGATVYVDQNIEQDLVNRNINLFIGRFVILEIDDERYRLEYPEKSIRIKEGFKIRKVLNFFDAEISKEIFTRQINDLIDKFNNSPYPNCIQERADFIEHLYNKFERMKNYYRNEEKIMVSVTYKEGLYRDFSFHSPRFIKGIVKYVTIN